MRTRKVSCTNYDTKYVILTLLLVCRLVISGYQDAEPGYAAYVHDLVCVKTIRSFAQNLFLSMA